MKQGWIKLHRKLLENPIFNSEKGLKVWIWCLLSANHQENFCVIGRQKLLIKKGQFIMGGIKAEQLLGIARTTIYNWLNFLQKEGMIDIKKTNKYTIITIPNWDKHQENGHQIDNKLTSKKHQIDTNKKDNKEKNDKNTGNEQVVAIDINKIIELFKPINPSYKQLYANKTERAALERMVKEHGEEKITNTITILPKIISKPYAPRITTPYQLEKKLGEAMIFIKQEQGKAEKQKSKVGIIQ